MKRIKVHPSSTMRASVIAVFGVLLASASLATAVSGSNLVAAAKSSGAEARRAQVSTACATSVRVFVNCVSTAAPGSCSCNAALDDVFLQCTTDPNFDNAFVQVNVALQDLENTGVRHVHTFSCECQLGPSTCACALLALFALCSECSASDAM